MKKNPPQQGTFTCPDRPGNMLTMTHGVGAVLPVTVLEPTGRPNEVFIRLNGKVWAVSRDNVTVTA